MDDRGERASLLDGAVATLRNPIQIAVILGLGAVMGLCFAAGQAPREIIIGSAALIAGVLFIAYSSAARQAATIGKYAKSRGLQFVNGQFPRFLVLPNGPQRLGAYPAVCQTVLIGSIAGGPPAMIAVLFPNVQRYRSSIPSRCLPIACYDFLRVSGALGTDVYSAWTADGRVASDPANDQLTTALLDPDLAAWLVKSGGVSFELSGGWLFVTDASCPPRPSVAQLDRLAEAAAHVAGHVLQAMSATAAVVGSPPTLRRGRMPRAFAASAVALLAFAAIIVWAIVSSGRLADLTAPPPGIGVPVDAGDQTIVVKTVEQWPGDGLFPPADGDVYVTVELAITPGNDATVDTLDTHVRAGDGSSYDLDFLEGREPSLPAGDLTPGVSVDGWMTFEVPAGLAGHLTLIYATSFANLHSPPVSIPLY